MEKGTNAPVKPEFEGQLVKFRSPRNPGVILVDEARCNEKYGWLEWWAVNPGDPDYARKEFQAMWVG